MKLYAAIDLRATFPQDQDRPPNFTPFLLEPKAEINFELVVALLDVQARNPGRLVVGRVDQEAEGQFQVDKVYRVVLCAPMV